MHELLRRRNVQVPYSTLYRFAVKHCGFSDRRRVTVRKADCEPGELAEIDFGRLGLIPSPETGRRRTAWALIVTLGHSRHLYVHTTFSQKIPDLIEGLEDAWSFFGGCVRRVVVDNLKTAITKADRYDPIFARTFEEYASYRGFAIDPAPPYMPTGKPIVERAVPYVRDNFFRGESWMDLDHLQREAVRWCLQSAGTRIHGTTRKRPLAVFENVEREQLLPLTRERYDPPTWAECKVHPDHHINFGKALYSVPTRYIRQQVWVRADSGLVRIYAEGLLIKTHPRQEPGGRATDYDDYPAELTPYALRDPQRIIRQATELSSDIGRFMEQLLSGTLPWTKIRQAQKLLRLTKKYGEHRVASACRRALAFELINVRRVESILLKDLDQLELPIAQDATVIPIETRFLRSPRSFSHSPTKESDS